MQLPEGLLSPFLNFLLPLPISEYLAYLLPDSMAPTTLVQLLSTDYKIAVSFGILVIVLLIKPTGLFSQRTA